MTITVSYIPYGHGLAIIPRWLTISSAIKQHRRSKEQTGTDITVINLRFVSGVDEELLDSLKKDHSLIITIEDGEVMGGYGQNIAVYYGDSDIRVHSHGISVDKLTAEMISALK